MDREKEENQGNIQNVYETMVGCRHPGGDLGIKRLAALETMYRRPGEGDFINLCCGDGRGMEWFADYPGEKYGLDCSGLLLGQAAEQFPHWHFLRGDIREPLPFEDGRMKAVLCECSLSMFPRERGRIQKEIRRILKPGGLFLAADVDQGWVEPEGFCCLVREEHPHWMKEFVARWLWEQGSLPCFGKDRELPGYFLGVYRRCD